MADRSIKVVPPELLAAAGSVAANAQIAAAARPGVVPVVTGASPADAALGGIASAIAVQTAQMSAAVAPKGPTVQATTSAGVAELAGTDADNAAAIQAVGTCPQGRN